MNFNIQLLQEQIPSVSKELQKYKISSKLYRCIIFDNLIDIFPNELIYLISKYLDDNYIIEQFKNKHLNNIMYIYSIPSLSRYNYIILK